MLSDATAAHLAAGDQQPAWRLVDGGPQQEVRRHGQRGQRHQRPPGAHAPGDQRCQAGAEREEAALCIQTFWSYIRAIGGELREATLFPFLCCVLTAVATVSAGTVKAAAVANSGRCGCRVQARLTMQQVLDKGPWTLDVGRTWMMPQVPRQEGPTGSTASTKPTMPMPLLPRPARETLPQLL